MRPLEIFIRFDKSDHDWALVNGVWHYTGEYNEKAALGVVDISVQMIGEDGIERVVDVPDAPFHAELAGDEMKFVLPADIDVKKLIGVWFRVVKKSNLNKKLRIPAWLRHLRGKLSWMRL